MTEPELISHIAARANQAGGVRALARDWGISPAMISDVINGRRGPGPKVLKAFGLKRVVRVSYEKGERA